MTRLFALLLTLCTLSASAQSEQIRFGAVATYIPSAKEVSYGGSFEAGIKWSKFSGAIGGQVLDLKGVGIYAPVYLSAGYSFKGFTVHVDPGFAIHKKTIQIDRATQYQQVGGFYLGAGLRYDLPKGFFVNGQYSSYGLALTNVKGSGSHTSAATLTLGFQLNP